ncbi:hypothetical protein AB0883_20895 [Micromonospora sp. NPDC047812]
MVPRWKLRLGHKGPLRFRTGSPAELLLAVPASVLLGVTSRVDA